MLEKADLATAVGFVAGTDNDTTNLSLVASARRINPKLFLAARQNLQASAPLFQAMQLDSLLVPTEVVAHEVYAQLSTPLLWRFVQEMPAKGDAWAAEVMERITGSCGRRLQELWKDPADRGRGARPASAAGWPAGSRSATCCATRTTGSGTLDIVPLLVLRGAESHLTPDADFVIQADDELLLAGRSTDRRALEGTLYDDAVCEYVLHDRHMPSSWVWRKLARSDKQPVLRD